jgi:mannonate dehydratase
MKETWRWFGPNDPVPLAHVRQAGASGVVTALHHVPVGAVWSVEEIETRKQLVEGAGLEWSVVESLPVSEEIKTRGPLWKQHIDAYRQSLRNLSACGIRIVCYNFMPVMDWTRTELAYRRPDGTLALRFDARAFAAFDLFILKRPGAEAEWGESRIEEARRYFDALDDAGREKLSKTVIAPLPGAEESHTPERFRVALSRYDDINSDDLRENLKIFMEGVIETAENAGIRLCIHPDDPPRPLLGLPRILSTASDVRWLFSAVDHPANGLTFCTGSFGVRADNDLPAMFREFGSRVHFIHLRSTLREDDPQSFHEAPHLDGDVDMVAMIEAILAEENHRDNSGREDAEIPMRPDHGHQMLDDIGKKVSNPGYSAIGRLKGLAELRGVARAVARFSPRKS